MTPFKLKIITPDTVLFDDETENVIVRTTVGDIGILARHEPYAAALPIGKMRVLDKNGQYKFAAISTGTIKVEYGGDTTVLVQSCEWKEDIDVPRAEQAKKTAESMMSDSGVSDIERDMAELKLKRAVNRLDVAVGDGNNLLS